MRSAVAGYCLSDVEDGGPFYCSADDPKLKIAVVRKAITDF